jgi:hypothetical protein
MAADEVPTHFLQLPRDVLCSVVGQCGPREKWALFLTCHFARCLVVEAAQQISGTLELSQLPRKGRPPLLMRGLDGSWLESVKLQLKDVSSAGLLQHAGQLRGIRHLKLVRVFAVVHASTGYSLPAVCCKPRVHTH